MGSRKSKSWKGKIETMLRHTGDAAVVLQRLSTERKNKILLEAAALLEKKKSLIISENQKDLKNAKQMGLTHAMIDRLTLTEDRIKAMADGVRAVAKLKDPIGCVQKRWRRPNGLLITRVTVPIGVIFIIYESRPNVTVECASLCIKSGNVVILKGGRERSRSPSSKRTI